jgi:Ca2+-binding EF-hand superfamily protein
MSVAAAGDILASVGLALVERRQKKIFQTQLNKGLATEHLKAMDLNQDGKVEREEYVLFMLAEMGLVNKNEIEELWEQFERLDVTKSGYLDHDDLLLMAKLRGAGLVE